MCDNSNLLTFLLWALWGWQNKHIIQTDKINKKAFRFWQHLWLEVVYVELGEELI